MENLVLITLLLAIPSTMFLTIANNNGKANFVFIVLKITSVLSLLLTTIYFLKTNGII